MYNILIVDDEYEIRQGLEDYDWASMNIQVAGSCDNGLAAFQKVLAGPVDILLTDIRMPFMDGFELIQKVRQEFPYIKIVILTGYSDFSYAKQGIQFGISDYLLKPANDKDIKEAFGKIIEELNVKKMIEIRNTALERKAKLSTQFLRKRFMQKLLFQSITQDEIEEGCSEGEMILESSHYAISMIRLDRKEEQSQYYSHREWDLIMFALGNVLSEVWDDQGHGYHWIDENTGKCYLLCTNPELLQAENSDASLFMEKTSSITNNLQRFRGLLLSTVSLGVGPVVDRATHIYESCLSIAQALDLNKNKQICITESSISNSTLSVLQDTNTTEIANPVKEGSPQGIIEEAKRYIDQNFERSITLQDVAEHIHFNPNYLSSLFRKATGKNYIHYLTDCRMQMAMKHLQHSNYKVYEISEMVGYSTTAYFIDRFRKHTGQTPQEFRSMQGVNGEEIH
ncbi:response regulator transcription factor [Paenibacillus eucommiae]|uniref:Two-component system response regulator YesN n=1 Tax=Paenibacillus eucommiae TaxID=1355755 RepID=A0ABS4J147_9BACL|nr:response regulator [Paenibacillus eucommiae]MBP1992986.1 two-component system response regulator YesN [Paenibacillus eucommiae]